MISDKRKQRPRLIALLTVFLLLQSPALIFIGLNLLTQNWTFLTSLSVFSADFRSAFRLGLETAEELVRDEVLIHNVMGFFVLLMGSGSALFAGLSFPRGRPMAWIMSLVTQIAVLVTGIGLYFVYQPNQSYWLILIGILMVLYLNYGDVRQWFLQSWGGESLSADQS